MNKKERRKAFGWITDFTQYKGVALEQGAGDGAFVRNIRNLKQAGMDTEEATYVAWAVRSHHRKLKKRH